MLHSLSRSGGVAAILVGIAVYVGFEAKGLLVLGAFFVSSSLWSTYKSSSKKKIEEKLEKGSARDWRQVVANGGAAALFSLFYYVHNDPTWLIGFLASISSSNSDTWASEIGSLSKRDPIFIRTFKPVDKGTSGAISNLGTIAAIAGALFIAFLGLRLFSLSIYTALIIFSFGFFGNVIDTLIGAFYQKVYICHTCGIQTEKKSHCGKATEMFKGFWFVDNDMVNFLSGFLAAIIAMFWFQFLG
ncbi:DUF92 domain-containing protein [Neobacillus sp. LXY-1]|uniref:DUF92 domain-containing protein n=1 Tax=Neobacillus sp. LXY-1 TaxID=3379133 RepID=UPI003EE2F502